MNRSRFTEEQIIGMLKEQEAGMSTADVCRKHGVSSATFYKFKARYGGLEVSDARRLKALEDENAKLKKLLAEAMLDNAILKDVAAKNGSARRQAGGGGTCRGNPRGEPAPGVSGSGGGSVERARPKRAPGRCRDAGGDEGGCGRAPAVRLPAPALHAGSAGDRDEPEEAEAALPRGTAPGAPTWRAQAGTRHAATDAGAEGRQPALEHRFRQRRLHRRAAIPGACYRRRIQPGMPGAGCRYLALRPPRRPRTRLADRPARPAGDNRLRQRDGADLDGDPKLVSAHRRRLALHRSRKVHARHGFVESFNGRFRDEVLFTSLREAREQIRSWQHDYNHHRPHSGLGNIPPAEFAEKNRLKMRAA